MKRVFNSDLLQQQYDEAGYVAVDLLSSEQVNRLRDVYDNHIIANDRAFFISNWVNDVQNRVAISNLSQKILRPYLDNLLQDFKTVTSVFAEKKAGTQEQFVLHQDISITDESKYASVNVWIPLQDVDETSGAIHLVPRSHLLPTPVRSNLDVSGIENIREHIVKNYARVVPLRAGQAMIWNHRLIHGSAPNLSSRNRIASVSLMIPRQAPVLFYYGTKLSSDNTIDAEVLQFDDDYYDVFDVKTKPSGPQVASTGEMQIKIHFYNESEFDKIAGQLRFR